MSAEIFANDFKDFLPSCLIAALSRLSLLICDSSPLIDGVFSVDKSLINGRIFLLLQGCKTQVATVGFPDKFRKFDTGIGISGVAAFATFWSFLERNHRPKCGP